MTFNLDAILLFNESMFLNLFLNFVKMQSSSSQVAMKCFSFYFGEKKDGHKSLQSILSRFNSSTYVEAEMRRSGSELNSMDASDNSTDSLRRSSFPSLSQRPSNLRVFTVSELKTATKSFSRSVMLGEGGFGCVYKGLIKSVDDPSTKIEVAVKQLGRRGIQARFCLLCFQEAF